MHTIHSTLCIVCIRHSITTLEYYAYERSIHSRHDVLATMHSSRIL